MNTLKSLFPVLLVAVAVFFASCGEDDTPIDIDPIGPDAALLAEAGFVSVADTLDPLTTFSVRLSAFSGNSALTSVEILENGITLDDLNRIVISGQAGSANPFALFGADTASFTKDITITATALYNDVSTYSFVVRDAQNQKDTVSVVITTPMEVVTTPLDGNLTGVLLNSDGPRGTGGVNLETGAGTGSTAVGSHLRDQGIDVALPAATNWRQKIAPITANSIEMREAAVGTDFNSVVNKEAIADIWAAATVSTETAKVQTGKILLAQKAGEARIYLVQVTAVNVMPTDNSDNYELSIKF